MRVPETYGALIEQLNTAIRTACSNTGRPDLITVATAAFIKYARQIGVDPAKLRSELHARYMRSQLGGCRPSRYLIDVLTTIPIRYNVRGVWKP